MIREYIRKVTGYSRSRTERLIAQYRRKGWIRKKRADVSKNRFCRKYTDRDIELLAKTDELHGWLSGPATRRILEREWQVFGNVEYRNISQISISHLYNLRRNSRYRAVTTQYTKTKPSVSKIGERVKPDPKGMPGYIRIDSVHQGDRDGEKGVYHINAVDEVTQWEVVASVEKISEAYLVLVLEEMLAQFPFTLLGFHSDNGSEFVNHVVAGLLNKLLIRLTKSRPRQSNDNGLVETKNGAVVRKELGYAYIPQKCAERLNEFHGSYFNLYINFHRPCFFPVSVIDHKGKMKKTYPYEEVRTPYEKLKSLPKAQKYLRAGVTFEALDAIAYQMSDNEFVERKEKARFDLFREINKSLKRVVS
jgi:transposase InsO family protein